MCLWVTPAESKLWRWADVFEDKEKLMALGRYPDISLAAAREQHAPARTLLASRVDPMAERKAAKQPEHLAEEPSFAKVAAQWLEHWKDEKSPRPVDATRRRLATNILPSLGRRPIAVARAGLAKARGFGITLGGKHVIRDGQTHGGEGNSGDRDGAGRLSGWRVAL